ncbi:MAG: diheme cytochrome c-553, partial [Candidatus Latescibacterota bacterium]
MNRKLFLTLAGIGALGIAATTLSALALTTPAHAGETDAASSDVARGKYLVTMMGCNDCHTPWAMTPRGPEPDMTRMLSGHPEDFPITAPKDLGEGPWTWAAAPTNTAFSGPWGVSFTANLTPDPETGLGKWTAETFITAIRTGRH